MSVLIWYFKSASDTATHTGLCKEPESEQCFLHTDFLSVNPAKDVSVELRWPLEGFPGTELWLTWISFWDHFLEAQEHFQVSPRFMLTNAESFKSLFHESTIQVQQLGPQANVTLSYCAACFSLHCTVLIKARGARSLTVRCLCREIWWSSCCGIWTGKPPAARWSWGETTAVNHQIRLHLTGRCGSQKQTHPAPCCERCCDLCVWTWVSTVSVCLCLEDEQFDSNKVYNVHVVM